MPFQPGDVVKHKSGKKKLVVIGQVGDGKPLPQVVEEMLNISNIPPGWYILQFGVKCGFKYDFAPDEALEYPPKPRQRTAQP